MLVSFFAAVSRRTNSASPLHGKRARLLARRRYQRGAQIVLDPLESRTFLSAVATIIGNAVTIPSGSTAVSRDNFTDFGPIGVSSGHVYRTYTIQNTGDATLTLSGGTPITITGPNAAEFTVTTPVGSSALAPGATTTFTVTFDPSAAGTRIAQIHLASNDPTTPNYNYIVNGTGLNVSTQSDGLQGAITQPGTGTIVTASGQALLVNYTGYLLDGTKFDSSLNPGRSPFQFTLGVGQVIAGWDEGMTGMKVGEHRTLIIPPALGYGATANGNIPANSTLIFETQLLQILGPAINVTGKGVSIADGDVTPATADDTSFAWVIPGTTVTHTFTITSSAPGSLSFLGNPEVQLSGTGAAQYAVTQPVVDSGGTFATFTVSYTPTGATTAGAIITIPTNDPNHGTYHFSVSGTGVFASDLSGVFASSMVAPGNVGAGDIFNAPVTISNAGPGIANGTVKITIKASSDGTWHDSDPTIGSIASQSIYLNNGGSATYTLPVTIPAPGTLPLGGYTLLAKVEPLTGITQDGSQNNTISTKSTSSGAAVTMNVVSAKPDLTVSFGTPLPNFANYVPGDSITLPVTVHNIGIRSAVGTSLAPIMVDVRLSTDGTYNSGDTLLTQLSIPSTILRGGSLTQNVTLKITKSMIPGAYYAVANADSTGVVDELDETNNTGASSALNVVWQFGTVTGRVGAVPLTFNDADGTAITLSLTGGGTATLGSGVNGYDITVTGSTLLSRLSISTTKTATIGDDGRFTLHSLTVGNPSDNTDHTSLGTIYAPTTDLSGDITITGITSSISWGNVAGLHHISIGTLAIAPLSPPSVSLIFGSIQDLTLNSGIGISLLQTTDWKDTDATADSLTAPWLSRLVVTGSSALALGGDFQANLTLTSATGLTSTTPTLSQASIAGSVGGYNWNIAGSIGQLTIGGTLGTVGTAWNLTGLTGASYLNLGDVVNGTISSSGGLATLLVKRWQAGSISAATLGTLQVTGKYGFFAGDFAANLILSGPPASVGQNVLNQAIIAGSLNSSAWSITGKIGSLTVVGTTGQVATAFDLTNFTGISTLSFGDVVNASVDGAGVISSITAKRWTAGDIQASALNYLNITGATGIAGDFLVNLTLSGAGISPTSSVLGTASIRGSVGAGTWDITGLISNITVYGSTGIDGSTNWQLKDFTNATTLNLGNVINATVTGTGNISTLIAIRWLAGSVNALTLNYLNITGATGIAGDFLANLTLSGTAIPPTSNVLGSASIRGSVGASIWDITGRIGSIAISGNTGVDPSTNWQLKDFTSASTLSLGSVINAVVTGTGSISTLMAIRWLAGSVNAGSLNYLNISGATGVAGDFLANLALSGNGVASASSVLGTAYVRGSVGAGTWDITGGIGYISVSGSTGIDGSNKWQLIDFTNASTLSLGNVLNAVVTGTGTINSLTAIRWFAGSVNALTLNSLSTTGATGIAGDFLANLTLSGTGILPTSNVLGSASIRGAVGTGIWDITGRIGSITVYGTTGVDASNQWQLKDFTSATTLSFGDVANATVTGSGSISTLMATRWLAGSVSAAALNYLNITGATGIAGDFLANLTLSGSGILATSNVLGTAYVRGSVGAGIWDITGRIGYIAISGTTGIDAGTDWQLKDFTSASTLSFGNVINATVTGSGSISTLTATRWLAGEIDAATLNSLSITGATGISGDFGADLNLDGPPAYAGNPVLGTASIAGHITGGQWNIAGLINYLRASAIDATWQGRITTATGNINTLQLTQIGASNTLDLQANAITSFSVAGSLLNSTITLSQGVSLLKQALSSLAVTGDITGSQIRIAGNIGSVQARSLNNSLLFAGVNGSLNVKPTSAGDFVDPTPANLPTIASLTLTGFPLAPTTAELINSSVAAGKITSVRFLSINPLLIDPTGASVSFGFATRLGVTNYFGPSSSGLYVSGTDSVVV